MEPPAAVRTSRRRQYEWAVYSKLASHSSNQKFFASLRFQGTKINERLFWETWRRHSRWAGVHSIEIGNQATAAVVTAAGFFDRLLEFYNTNDLWELDPAAETVLLPTVLDGRRIWGSNELIAVHFRNCYTPHNAAHCHALAVSKFPSKESFAALERLEAHLHWGEVRAQFQSEVWQTFLLQAVPLLLTKNSKLFPVGGRYRRVLSPVIADWLSLSAVCNNNVSARCTRPDQRLCCVCQFSTEEKIDGWREHPFLQWRRDLDGTWTHRRLWNIQPSQALWGVRHLLTRSLDYLLHHIENTLASLCSANLSIHSIFKDFLSDVLPKWKPAAALNIKAVSYRRRPSVKFSDMFFWTHPHLQLPR